MTPHLTERDNGDLWTVVTKALTPLWSSVNRGAQGSSVYSAFTFTFSSSSFPNLFLPVIPRSVTVYSPLPIASLLFPLPPRRSILTLCSVLCSAPFNGRAPSSPFFLLFLSRLSPISSPSSITPCRARLKTLTAQSQIFDFLNPLKLCCNRKEKTQS